MVRTIVTVGPRSLDVNTITNLKTAGASSLRINLSHSNKELLEKYFDVIESCGQTPSIDTQGAQLRVEEIVIPEYPEPGYPMRVIFGRKIDGLLEKNFLRLNHPEASDQVEKDDVLRVDFSGFSVALKSKVSETVWDAVVETSGKVTLNRAADIINKTIALDILTGFDKYAIDYAVSRGCTEIYGSFVSSANQVRLLRETAGSDAVKIISKIETARGVANSKTIAESSDEVLVDRGDLSREIGIPSVPIAVSGITKICQEACTPVNIATNVLDSMMTEKLPSRAEISDIFSLLNSGIDGFVLAAEVAIGRHPVESTALLCYLISLYENHKYGLHGIARPAVPDSKLIGQELINWL